MSVGIGSEIPSTMPVSIAGTVLVNGSSSTQPVSGTFFQTTQPISVAATLSIKFAYSYLNITSNATTTVKSGAGTFHGITISGIGTSAVVSIYDNTAGSGTKIGTLTIVSGIPGVFYDVAFSTGLTIVTTGVAAADITVSYL